MGMNREDRIVRLQPDWKQWFWHWMAGVVLTPLFGVGLILLWRQYRVFRELSVEVTDHEIRISDQKGSTRIPIQSIRETTVHQSWLNRRFNIGRVRLEADNGNFTLEGMNRPKRLATMILNASEQERARLAKMEEEIAKKPAPPPLQTDRINDLTGMWQQGLLSDEDFQREKKHFES